MSTTLSKRPLRVPQTTCDTFEERAVDMDVVLPDYLPEISAVLKCSMRPFITARNQSGDRYTVDGTVCVRVLYVSEDRKTLHCYETSQPFHISFASGDSILHYVYTKTDYVNCRAIAPRRLDVHGAFRVFFKAVGEAETMVLSSPSMRDVFCKTETVLGIVPTCETDKSVVMEERIDLGESVDRLIFADAEVISSDIKMLVNKMIVKGTLRVKAVYVYGDECKTMIQEVPFSQVVDVEGACDQWRCCAEVLPGECDAYLHTQENGNTCIMFHAKLNVCVRCFITREETVVLDAYSVSAPLLCETTPITFSMDDSLKCETVTARAQTDLPEHVSRVVQLWGDMKNFEIANGTWKMCLALGMIAADVSGDLAYYERTVDISGSHNAGSECSGLRLLSVEGNVNGQTLHLQIEAEMKEEFHRTETHMIVCNAYEEQNASFAKSNATIRIVYADAGESVWNIAKAHHACMQDILAENDLSESVITVPTMLLIPLM